jgi:hypothetical protein
VTTAKAEATESIGSKRLNVFIGVMGGLILTIPAALSPSSCQAGGGMDNALLIKNLAKI